MITTVKHKDILDEQSPAKTIVIPVNCVGIMGKGLALQFRNKYPILYSQYYQACKEKRIIIPQGVMLQGNKLYYMFPTKSHWRHPSEYTYINNGLSFLFEQLQRPAIQYPIAFPKIGCGLGQLNWDVVKPLIEMFDNKDRHIMLYEE